MIAIYHSKDLDGFASGAIVKRKYPDCQLIGWDYKDPIPNLNKFKGEDIILIDISFPMVQMSALAFLANSVTWIDHHISAKKEYDIEVEKHLDLKKINYVYVDGVAACEIGWKYLFPEEPVPYALTLLGRYDTWRQKEGDWEGETLPFQYGVRVKCTSAETFDTELFNPDIKSTAFYVLQGKTVLTYQEQQDMLACERSAFEVEVYGGLNAICLNTRAFSSNTLKSVYNPERHDIMIGFEWTGIKWSVSLRSIGDDADCSVIAKQRGGGGHKNAAGFETYKFEEIFK